jgi:mRNA interferase MazF
VEERPLDARAVRRGEVYVLDLSELGGSLTKERPVLVFQNDVGNARSKDTIVLAVRDLHGGRLLPIFVPVSRGLAGLKKDSIVDAGHIMTVAKDRLGRRLRSLPQRLMASVDQALRVSLELI